jgi:hypothetical protein
MVLFTLLVWNLVPCTVVVIYDCVDPLRCSMAVTVVCCEPFTVCLDGLWHLWCTLLPCIMVVIGVCCWPLTLNHGGSLVSTVDRLCLHCLWQLPFLWQGNFCLDYWTEPTFSDECSFLDMNYCIQCLQWWCVLSSFPSWFEMTDSWWSDWANCNSVTSYLKTNPLVVERFNTAVSEPVTRCDCNSCLSPIIITGEGSTQWLSGPPVDVVLSPFHLLSS